MPLPAPGGPSKTIGPMLRDVSAAIELAPFLPTPIQPGTLCSGVYSNELPSSARRTLRLRSGQARESPVPTLTTRCGVRGFFRFSE